MPVVILLFVKLLFVSLAIQNNSKAKEGSDWDFLRP